MLNAIKAAMFLTLEYGRRYTIGICCSTTDPDYDGLIQAFQGKNAEFVFEKRGTQPVTEMNVNAKQLSSGVYVDLFKNSNVVYQNSTTEPVSVWGGHSK